MNDYDVEMLILLVVTFTISSCAHSDVSERARAREGVRAKARASLGLCVLL